MSKIQRLKQNIKNKIHPRVFQICQVTFKILFHYADLITDIMLIIQIFEISAKEIEKSGHTSEQINSFMSGETLLMFVLLDRFMSYHDLLSQFKQQELRKLLEQQNDQENNQLTEREFLQKSENIKLPFIKKIKSFLLILTYSDYLYVAIQGNHELEIVMIKKQMIELYCENLAFFIIGITVLQYQYIMNGEIDPLVLFSMTLSCFACCYVIFTSYIQRAQEHVRFKDKEELQFALLPEKTKQFLAYPYTINFLKMYSPQVNNYQDLFVESHHLENQINKLIPQNKYNKVLNQEIQKCIKQEKLKHTLNCTEKCYLMFNLIISIFGYSFLDMTHAWSQGAIDMTFTFLIAFIAYLPQFSVHLCLSFKDAYRRGILALIKQFFIELIQTLFIPLLGTLMFLTPMKTEEIPMLRKTRENWMTNFFNSLYIITIKTGYQTYCIIQAETIVYDGEKLKYEGFTQDQINNFTNEQGLIRYFYLFGFWCFVTQCIFNFSYLLECLYYNYIVQYTEKNNPKIQQKLYKKQLKKYLEQINLSIQSKIETPSVQYDQSNHKINFQKLTIMPIDQQQQAVVDVSFNQSSGSSSGSQNNNNKMKSIQETPVSQKDVQLKQQFYQQFNQYKNLEFIDLNNNNENNINILPQMIKEQQPQLAEQQDKTDILNSSQSQFEYDYDAQENIPKISPNQINLNTTELHTQRFQNNKDSQIFSERNSFVLFKSTFRNPENDEIEGGIISKDSFKM